MFKREKSLEFVFIWYLGGNLVLKSSYGIEIDFETMCNENGGSCGCSLLLTLDSTKVGNMEVYFSKSLTNVTLETTAYSQTVNTETTTVYDYSLADYVNSIDKTKYLSYGVDFIKTSRGLKISPTKSFCTLNPAASINGIATSMISITDANYTYYGWSSIPYSTDFLALPLISKKNIGVGLGSYNNNISIYNYDILHQSSVISVVGNLFASLTESSSNALVCVLQGSDSITSNWVNCTDANGVVQISANTPSTTGKIFSVPINFSTIVSYQYYRLAFKISSSAPSSSMTTTIYNIGSFKFELDQNEDD